MLKGPPPWLAPFLALISMVLFVAWAYLQIRHWRESNADFLGMGLTLLLYIVPAAFLVIAFLLYRERATQSDATLRSFQASQAAEAAKALQEATKSATTPLRPKSEPLQVRVTMLDTRGTKPETTYIAKLRVVLTNASEHAIHLEAPFWTTGGGNVSVQTGAALYEGIAYKPGYVGLGYRYQLEKEIDGWKRDDWRRMADGKHEEHQELDVQPGWTFRIWIGLDPMVPHTELEKRRKGCRLGTVTIPMMIGKTLHQWSAEV